MYSKKDLLDSLEVINENLNTLIHNQMIIYGEIKKLLEADGWRLVRVCGSHNQFRRVGNPYAVTVPNHGSRSISIGVIKDLERKTGLSLRR